MNRQVSYRVKCSVFDSHQQQEVENQPECNSSEIPMRPPYIRSANKPKSIQLHRGEYQTAGISMVTRVKTVEPSKFQVKQSDIAAN